MRKVRSVINRGRLYIIFFRLARARGYSLRLTWEFVRECMAELDKLFEEIAVEVKHEKESHEKLDV